MRLCCFVREMLRRLMCVFLAFVLLGGCVTLAFADATASSSITASKSATLAYTLKGLKFGRAVQNFYIGETYIYITQRKDDITYLSRLRIDSAAKTATYMDHMVLNNFGHGQSLDFFRYNGKEYFYVGCKDNDNSDGNSYYWSLQIARVQYEAGKTYDYTDFRRFSYMNYANKAGTRLGDTYRVAAGVCGSYTIFRVQTKEPAAVSYAIYDTNTINKLLDNSSTKYYDINTSAFAAACKFSFTQTGDSIIRPNGSFQGIDLSSKDSIYLSGGAEGDTPQIARMNTSGAYKKLIKITNVGKHEIEGVQCDRGRVYFLIVPSTDSTEKKNTQQIWYLNETDFGISHTLEESGGTAPTCTTAGLSKAVKCTTCGFAQDVQETLPATGHKSAALSAVAPTCTQSGLTAGSYCSVCNAVLTAQSTVPATGHSYQSAVTAPTCTAAGFTTHTCSVCGNSYQDSQTAAKGHSYDSGIITTQPSCTDYGSKLYTCSACSHYYTEEISPTGHINTSTETTDATCTETGSVIVTCACGEVISSETVAPLGHAEVVDKALEATCTTSGLTEGKHCSVCGEVLVAQEVIPPGEHANTTTTTKAATCTESGSVTVTCNDCGEVIHTEVIAAAGHSYAAITIAPACTERGYTVYICICGASYITDYVEASGHSYSYESNGENHNVTCANCDYAATEDHNFVDGTCICGAVESTEPTLDSTLSFGAQLYLENDLTMAFRVKGSKLANYDISTAYLVVEREVYESGAKEAFVETMTITDYTVSADGRYVFSYPGIAAAQMNDAIRATLYIKDANGKEYVSPVLNTSVATYLDGLLSNSTSDTKLVTLILDMVNYGAAAQVYFDRHADAPVNEAFESFKTYASYASADFTTILEDLSATNDVEGKSGKLNQGLDLGTRIGIQYKVTLPNGINAEDAQLVITDANGNILEAIEVASGTIDSKGRYIVNFYGSTSKDMRRTVYATAYANGAAITGTYAYSISTYAWGIQENASAMDASLVAVTRAMMLYGDSASIYFG